MQSFVKLPLYNAFCTASFQWVIMNNAYKAELQLLSFKCEGHLLRCWLKHALCTITVCKTIDPDLIEHLKACLSAPHYGSLDMVKGFKIWQFKTFSSLPVHFLGSILNSYHCIWTLNERQIQISGWKAFRYLWFGTFDLNTVIFYLEDCNTITDVSQPYKYHCCLESRLLAQICILL